MKQPHSMAGNQSSYQLTAALAGRLYAALEAIDALQLQILQMRSMFDDEDGSIQDAMKNADIIAISANEILAQYNGVKLSAPEP